MTSHSDLVRVDRLSLTFLVDNSIEWMTKLPPGFKHEIRCHLASDPPVDARTGAPIVDLPNYCCGAHGLSVLIETQKGENTYRQLFDTGPDSRSIVRNIEALKVQVGDIERVILSHWHSDHSGGLLALLRYRGDMIARTSSEATKRPPLHIIVDLHPDRPIARGIAPPPTYTKVIGRLPEDPSFDEIRDAGGTVELNADGHTTGGGTVYVSGSIPRVTEFEGGLLGGVRWFEDNGKGEWKAESHIMDERYAAIDVLGKGLIVFSACSHAGIVNVIRDAVSRFSRPIYMIIGGLHLAGPELVPRIPQTVEFLSQSLRPAPTYILPMHCSGFAVKVALEKVFGEGCVPASTGMQVNVDGQSEIDDRLTVNMVV